MYIITGCLLLFLAIICYRASRPSRIHRHGKPLLKPPGTLPIVGNGIWFMQPRHRLLEWFADCERRTGFETYEITVPSLPPGIIVSDPRNVDHIFKHADIFIKGDFFRSRSWDLFGNGIINADGDLWKTQRKAGLRFFSNANLKRFIDEVLPPLLDDTQRTLDDAAEIGECVDMQAVLLELTTRLMGIVAYDIDMPSSLPFSRAFDYASGATGDRFQNPLWKISDLFWGAPFRRAVKEVKRFGDEIVSTAVSKHGHKKHDDALQGNLIDSLLTHIPDQRVVADAAMNYLSAGRDTTAQSLTWAQYLLIQHEDMVQTSLLPELSHLTPSPRPTFDTIQSGTALPYTTAIFFEAIRLYPPVPAEIKECTAATTFPDGTSLPQGAIVMWIPWAMGRSQGIWGADATEFKPERWLTHTSSDDTVGVLAKSASEFPMFNGGPRACLGKKFAEMLGVSVLASLNWRYRFTLSSQEQRSSQNSLTLPMEGGLPCRVMLRTHDHDHS